MATSVVEEVRLTAFKSFRDAVLPLDELTLLVGRNGSGKSNALDGLWALTRLAHVTMYAAGRDQPCGAAWLVVRRSVCRRSRWVAASVQAKWRLTST